MEFPRNFIWGTATSAHQTEGNDNNCDWWDWETRELPKGRRGPEEPSGVGCNSYARYTEDFDLCRKLNNNAVRFSLAWNRIEPEEGKFDQEAVEHYKKVIQAAKSRGLKTFVALHHFTNPSWFAKKGAFLNFRSPFYFSRYAKYCSQQFGELIDFYLTINEPQVYTFMSYFKGIWPPNHKNPLESLLVQINLLRSHVQAYKAIKSQGNHPVGIVKHIVWYETDPEKGSFLDKIAARLVFNLNCKYFLNPIRKYLDFLGVNYYFTQVISGLHIRNPKDNVSDMGWWINPSGLESILLKLKKYQIPIYITENGVADAKDTIRENFIHDMLLTCYKAISKGVDLKGYFYWSLIDNYEWNHGYWPRFGLVEIDRQDNLKRIPRKSFFYYAKICRANNILP